MMIKIKMKSGDTVEVISGSDKGKTGKVIRVFPKQGKILVSGISIRTKHKKADKGGITKVESKIHISNVSLTDSESSQKSRVGYKFDQNGKKFRFFKKSDSSTKTNTGSAR